ncbi:MAG: zinc ribbon domain-containing protein [Candidatus Thermoplasmatota archaeon]|nr:zinc ribbon domain-containing protein [Candidatus Thermoplasmatota archaeon]
MRRIIASLMLLMLTLATAGLCAGPVAATDALIPAGLQLTVTMTVSADSTISYSWNSDGALQFVLRDQAMNNLRTGSGTIGSGLYTVDNGGVYTLVWTNLNAGPVEIEYDVEVINLGAGFFDELGDAIILGMLIVLAVIVIIVVVVVLVVVRGKKKEPQAMTGPGAGIVPPMGNNCGVCGTPIDHSMAFCAKCGAKLR